MDIYTTLNEYTNNIIVYDPWADVTHENMNMELILQLWWLDGLKGKFDAVVLSVAHDEFKDVDIKAFLKDETDVLYDVKGILDRNMIDGRL